MLPKEIKDLKEMRTHQQLIEALVKNGQGKYLQKITEKLYKVSLFLASKALKKSRLKVPPGSDQALAFVILEVLTASLRLSYEKDAVLETQQEPKASPSFEETKAEFLRTLN